MERLHLQVPDHLVQGVLRLLSRVLSTPFHKLSQADLSPFQVDFHRIISYQILNMRETLMQVKL